MSRNISEVRLLNVPLEADLLHTLYFSSKAKQTEYFKSRTKHKAGDYSYIRKDKVIRWETDYDSLLDVNYVMYNNTATSDKWYYAFITDLEYVSDGLTRIHIETDPIQTWLFDYKLKQSFVEREHVSDDGIGEHTIPENLELGEYICNGYQKDEKLYPEAGYAVVGSTVVPVELGKLTGGKYNGIFSGVKYYCYPTDQLGEILQNVTDNYDDSAITSVFLAPSFLTNHVVVSDSDEAAMYAYSVPKKYGLEGYTPKNNKLKTYPYCYLLVSNGNGACAEYRYEFFESTTCDFAVYGALTPGCSIRLIPTIYKNTQLPETEGLNLGKYPQCNWATDQYTNWLTQNGVNIATGLINAGVSAAGGAAMGSVIPGVGTAAGAIIGAASGLTGIANTLNEIHKAQMIPPQTQGNINCGDVVTSMKNNTFHYYNMSIRAEYAKIIDKYFDMFGYKVNMVKVPEKNHRKNYWFTKCIDVNIDGSIPADDMQKIKNCYNTGITFWKDPEKIQDYSVSNGII